MGHTAAADCACSGHRARQAARAPLPLLKNRYRAVPRVARRACSADALPPHDFAPGWSGWSGRRRRAAAVRRCWCRACAAVLRPLLWGWGPGPD
jgi:hypothetical protein